MRSVALLVAVAIIACGFLRAEDAAPPPAPKEETLKLEKGDLQVLIETDGMLEAAKKKKVKLTTDELPGPFTILEIAPSGQAVQAGAVLCRLDTVVTDRTMRAAREALETARIKLEASKEGFNSTKTSNKLKLDRMVLDLDTAIRDQRAFEKYGDEQMLRSRNLSVKNQEYYLDDRKEELNQLERMYKESQLAGETKEIVVERARRQVATTSESLDLMKKSQAQMLEFEYPVRKQLLNLSIEQKKQDLELLRTSIRLLETTGAEDLKTQERGYRDAQERMTRLENDYAQLVVKAPIAGTVSYKGLEAGDKVMANAVFMEVLDLSRMEIKTQLSLRDAMLLKAGDKVQIRVADLPEMNLDGRIEEIGDLPTFEPEKGGARVAVKVSVEEDRKLKPFLKARVVLKDEKLKKVISVPRSAVTSEDGRNFCRVRSGKSVEKKEVVTGPGNRERVQIVKGLSDGDVVIVK